MAFVKGKAPEAPWREANLLPPPPPTLAYNPPPKSSTPPWAAASSTLPQGFNAGPVANIQPRLLLVKAPIPAPTFPTPAAALPAPLAAPMMKAPAMSMMPGPSSMPPEPANTLSLVEYKNRIMQIYTIRNPEKIHQIDYLLQKYAGKEEFLYQSICQKYNIDPNRWSSHSAQLSIQSQTAQAAQAMLGQLQQRPPLQPQLQQQQLQQFQQAQFGQQAMRPPAPSAPAPWHRPSVTSAKRPAAPVPESSVQQQVVPNASSTEAPAKRQKQHEVMEWDPATGEMVATNVDLDADILEELMGASKPPAASSASSSLAIALQTAPSTAQPSPEPQPPAAAPPSTAAAPPSTAAALPSTATAPAASAAPISLAATWASTEAPSSSSSSAPVSVPKNEVGPIEAQQEVPDNAPQPFEALEEEDDYDPFSTDPKQPRFDMVEVDFLLVGERTGFFEDLSSNARSRNQLQQGPIKPSPKASEPAVAKLPETTPAVALTTEAETPVPVAPKEETLPALAVPEPTPVIEAIAAVETSPDAIMATLESALKPAMDAEEENSSDEDFLEGIHAQFDPYLANDMDDEKNGGSVETTASATSISPFDVVQFQ